MWKKVSKEEFAAAPSSPRLMEIQENQQKMERRKDLFQQLLDQNQEHPAHPHHHCHHHDHEMEEQTEEHPGCKCTKIDCLKLYCECFAKGRVCNRKCICVCCQNFTGNDQNIYRAKQIANLRKPGHFKGIPALVPVRKCTCKKSYCHKNYCQCYRAGVKCNEGCQCLDCQNGKPHSHSNGFQEMYGIGNYQRIQIATIA